MYESKKTVAFFDADPAGIMFFGNLFKYIHSSYEEFLSKVNSKINYFNHDKVVLPITHTEADYFSPFYMHEALKVEVQVSKLKTSSFELSYKIYGSQAKLKATAKTVHVCVEKKSMKKTALPSELKKYLNENKI